MSVEEEIQLQDSAFILRNYIKKQTEYISIST